MTRMNPSSDLYLSPLISRMSFCGALGEFPADVARADDAEHGQEDGDQRHCDAFGVESAGGGVIDGGDGLDADEEGKPDDGRLRLVGMLGGLVTHEAGYDSDHALRHHERDHEQHIHDLLAILG